MLAQHLRAMLSKSDQNQIQNESSVAQTQAPSGGGDDALDGVYVLDEVLLHQPPPAAASDLKARGRRSVTPLLPSVTPPVAAPVAVPAAVEFCVGPIWCNDEAEEKATAWCDSTCQCTHFRLFFD